MSGPKISQKFDGQSEESARRWVEAYARLTPEQRATAEDYFVCYGTAVIIEREDGTVQVAHPTDFPV